MSYIVDRRLNSKNRSVVNRQRFLDRYRKHIKRAVADAVDNRSITDMERGESVTIPQDDISEPVLTHGKGGRQSVVHPGNKEFVAGDKIRRPAGGGSGGGGGDASDSGEGTDEFAFQLTQKEFVEYLFDDLELPNLTKRQLKGSSTFKMERAGYTSDGIPSRLSINRSMIQAKARRIALSADAKRQMALAEDKLEEAEDSGDELGQIRVAEELELLQKRIQRVPFIETTDLRYRLYQKRPIPTSQAVMFCLMDVSGSMDQEIKDLAKRFYLLLYMFLNRHYERTEVVFIRHHTAAKEVDEEEFFYSRETGGTVVSSALELMSKIIKDRYSPEQWNIYGAQASDGDNWNDDSPRCSKLLREDLLPMVQYFAYVEITKRDHQALWREYQSIADEHPEMFAQRNIRSVSDIFPVFRDLFHKREVA